MTFTSHDGLLYVNRLLWIRYWMLYKNILDDIRICVKFVNKNIKSIGCTYFILLTNVEARSGWPGSWFDLTPFRMPCLCRFGHCWLLLDCWFHRVGPFYGLSHNGLLWPSSAHTLFWPCPDLTSETLDMTLAISVRLVITSQIRL